MLLVTFRLPLSSRTQPWWSWLSSHSVSHVPARVWSSVGFQLNRAWACRQLRMKPSVCVHRHYYLPSVSAYSRLTVNETKACVLRATWWAEKAISCLWLSGLPRPLNKYGLTVKICWRLLGSVQLSLVSSYLSHICLRSPNPSKLAKLKQV